MFLILRSGTLHYTVTHSSQATEHIHASYQDALARKNMNMYLPAGISAADFIQTWSSLSYGESGATEQSKEKVVVSPSRQFLPAGGNIQRLRRMARRGQAATEAIDSTDAKVVWSQTIEQSSEIASGFGRVSVLTNFQEQRPHRRSTRHSMKQHPLPP